MHTMLSQSLILTSIVPLLISHCITLFLWCRPFIWAKYLRTMAHSMQYFKTSKKPASPNFQKLDLIKLTWGLDSRMLNLAVSTSVRKGLTQSLLENVLGKSKYSWSHANYSSVSQWIKIFFFLFYRTYKLECAASIKLRRTNDESSLYIDHLHLEHNHAINRITAAGYPENRRV